MKGDFSKLAYRPRDNHTGVLHQQGRVFLDQDGNAAGDIARHLRHRLGRDTIGPDRVGIPAAEPDGLKVEQAEADGSRVLITLGSGRGWIDGLHLYIPDVPAPPGPLTLEAGYLGHFVDYPPPDPGSIAAGVRDAVILEAWEEGFSGFQDPERFIEPALGGPDTTQRSKLSYALRLLRLRPHEDCGNLAERLRDDPTARGRLTVAPSASVVFGGDCPVELGGGYSGFEHYFYRIEIAEPDGGGNARFKWSRFNGGLVGRGTYDSVTDEVAIDANDPMINRCGLSGFYFEALSYDSERGHWRVVFTATASLVEDGLLSLTTVAGTWPGSATDPTAFFRLWDGIARIDHYAAADPIELEHGIELRFTPPEAGNRNYRPGDFWTFPVRTSGVDFDPAVWPSDALPHGVRYWRAPLAILNWSGGPVVSLTGRPEIHDCRHRFQPLTQLKGCCTYKVGDGLHSHGDFYTIQEALAALPAEGGEVCVLPGTYHENVVIERDNIRLHGCGERSRIVANTGSDTSPPAVTLRGATNVSVESLQVEASEEGIGVLVEGAGERRLSSDIRLLALTLRAQRDSAIKVLGGRHLVIRDCRIAMADVFSPWPGIFLVADEVLIEHNVIRVVPRERGETRLTTAAVVGEGAGRGGLQIGGTAERVRVIDNLIEGGIGNGITLGSLEEIDAEDHILMLYLAWVIDIADPCDAKKPGKVFVPPRTEDEQGRHYASAGALYDIRIERNRIRGMGLNGIGVAAFFDLNVQDDLISVEGLAILGNTIHGCLQRPLEPVPDAMEGLMGYGGIALADVEHLVMYDNVIEDNGPDHREPVCGVYLLHGIGVDLVRNRIVNNGARNRRSGGDIKRGPRAGLYIAYAAPPRWARGEVEPSGAEAERLEITRVSASPPAFADSGVPAVRIHQNIVVQPLGPALVLRGIGAMSIVANQFTSHGIVTGRASPGFTGTTVTLLNLGVSNEMYRLEYGFHGTRASLLHFGPILGELSNAVIFPDRGAEAFGFGRYLASGKVWFTDNQCLAELSEPGFTLSTASILIMGLDDIAFLDNLSQCNLWDDFMLADTLVLGTTIRVSNNRFAEAIGRVLFSSLNMGLILNTTTDNQATQCMLSLQSPLSGARALIGLGGASVLTPGFDVVLTRPGSNSIQTIKAVRKVTGLGLKEAKDLVDNTPSTLKEGISQSEANNIRAELQQEGASVEVIDLSQVGGMSTYISYVTPQIEENSNLFLTQSFGSIDPGYCRFGNFRNVLLPQLLAQERLAQRRGNYEQQ
jgi:ribosomal protein L7/L12